jgi:thiol:disulfide interchange protein
MTWSSTLARFRTRLGLIMGAAAFWLAQPTLDTVAAGAMIAAFGEALRIWAAGHLQKSREVTSSGPYRWFGHPLYVGSSVMGAGLAVASASVAVTLLIVTYLGATIAAAVKTEEAFLRQRFGDEYDRYRAGSRATVTRRFSLERAFANGEHRTIAGLIVVVLLLALKATYNGLFWRAAGR